GNLLEEQLLDEFRVSARQDDLDAVSGFLDLDDDGIDAVADVVLFAGDLFAARQDGLGLRGANGDGGGAVLVARHGGLDKFALAGGDGAMNANGGHHDVLGGSLLGEIFLGGEANGLFDDAKEGFARNVPLAMNEIDVIQQGFSVHAEVPPAPLTTDPRGQQK